MRHEQKEECDEAACRESGMSEGAGHWRAGPNADPVSNQSKDRREGQEDPVWECLDFEEPCDLRLKFVRKQQRPSLVR